MLAQQHYKSTGDILCEEGAEFVRKRRDIKWRHHQSGGADSSEEDELELELESRRKPLLFNEKQESSVNSLWAASTGKLLGNQYKQQHTHLLQAGDISTVGQEEQLDPAIWWADRKLKSFNVETEKSSEYNHHHYVKTRPIKEQQKEELREQPVASASNSSRQLKRDRIGKWRANGARRRKVDKANRLRLALSSPILAGSTLSAEIAEQQQQLLARSTGLTNSAISREQQQSQTTDNAQVTSKLGLESELKLELKLANGDAFPSNTNNNLEDEDGDRDKEEACEIATSKTTSSMRVETAASDAERGYCFVEVAQLRSADKQVAGKPVQCQLTIGESSCCRCCSCCYDEGGNSNNKTSCSAYAKTQNSVDDNGIDFSSSPSKLIAAHSKGVGGSEQQQQQQQQSQSTAPTSAAQIVVTTSSGNSSSRHQSSILPILNIQKQQQRKNFHYAPAQQVSHANHDQDLKLNYQQEQELRESKLQTTVNSKNERQKLPVETLVFSQGDGQRTSKTPTPTTTTTLPFKTNTVTGKLMGSYCNSWRQALHPNNSGTYKVAQQQQQGLAAISGSVCQPLEITEINGQQQVDVSATRNVISAGGGSSGSRRAVSTRLPRPNRSPVSLQRQTNTRLIKHRLKIQQQRQEQLAQLAIRERQQLHQSSSKQNQPSNSRTQIMPLEEWMQEIPNQTLYVINNSKPSFHRSTTRNNKSTSTDTQDSTRLLNPTHQPNGLNLAYHHQQHQVIVPTTTSTSIIQPATRAIEICDNQLACSSRQNQPAHSYISIMSSQQTSNSSTSRQSSNLVNKTFYKTINMLQNATNSHLTGNQQQNSIGRKKITRFEGSNKEADKADDDDAKTISSNGSTLSLNRPFCKICHIGSTKNGDKLISPCKCSGTMQYIHCGCLLKWLEISNRSNEKPMCCELCAHEYSWHKKFNYKHIKWPRCSIKDILLHIIFVIAIGIMIFSALAPIVQKRVVDTTRQSTSSYGLSPASSVSTSSVNDDSQPRAPLQNSQIYHATFNGRSNHLTTTGHLAHEEKFMLICAALFFLSFFLAIYVQTNARDTLYGLVSKFLNLNQTYYITEYDHGQLNGNINNINTTNCKQHQQLAQGHQRAHRKSGSEVGASQ